MGTMLTFRGNSQKPTPACTRATLTLPPTAIRNRPDPFPRNWGQSPACAQEFYPGGVEPATRPHVRTRFPPPVENPLTHAAGGWTRRRPFPDPGDRPGRRPDFADFADRANRWKPCRTTDFADFAEFARHHPRMGTMTTWFLPKRAITDHRRQAHADVRGAAVF